MINIKINNIKIQIKKNLTVLQACNLLNIDIPKFCYNKNLKIAGNCRMCLVEIKNSIKPVASCALPVTNNMEIFTNTPLVKKARESVLEFLLLNHPLDCPICDQGGICDLQDQALLVGSDKSRFFFKKRTVEDKNCGPLIKTVMTRCIHCTRCVRFSQEVSNTDYLGTVGRGNSTEISFYLNKIFNSEFSGNVIDLCPVGALTAKPLSFQTRFWELNKIKTIDILDTSGSNIQVDYINNNIKRITPLPNKYININWITNKTRFFFDSFLYQRIKTPLLLKNNEFIKINWEDAFKIIKKKIKENDSTNIKSICGNLNDITSLYSFKKFFNYLGVLNTNYDNIKQKNRTKSNFTNDFLYNNLIYNIKKTDFCFLINCDTRLESPILNIHLKNVKKNNNLKIYTIGSNPDLIFKNINLSLNTKLLIKIIEGKHFLCKYFKKSKKPLIIFGNIFTNNYKNKLIIKKFNNIKQLKRKNWFTNNNIQTETGFLNFLEVNFKNKKIKTKKNFIYLLNTYNSKINKECFKIYQGFFFTENAQNSDLILPNTNYFEKKGIFLNKEGFIQKTPKILKMVNKSKNDNKIFKNLIIFLKNKNINFNIFKIMPYLIKNKLKVKYNNTFYLNKKNKLKVNKNIIQKPLYNYNSLNNILEKNSKTIVKFNRQLKKKNYIIDIKNIF